jgi:hypothetical protein
LPASKSAHEECLTAWYDQPMSCGEELNLWARFTAPGNSGSVAICHEVQISSTGATA